MIDMPENRHEHQAYRDFWGRCAPRWSSPRAVPWPWQGQKAPVAKPCLKMMDGMYLFSDGRVTLCCWDTKERGVVGDITQDSVLEVWSSAQFEAVRTLLNDGRRELIHLCSRCDAASRIPSSDSAASCAASKRSIGVKLSIQRISVRSTPSSLNSALSQEPPPGVSPTGGVDPAARGHALVGPVSVRRATRYRSEP